MASFSSLFDRLLVSGHAKQPNDSYNIRRCPPVGTVIIFFFFIFFREFPLILAALPKVGTDAENGGEGGRLALAQLLMQVIGIICTIFHTLVRVKKEVCKQDPVFQPLDKSHCLQLGICISFTVSSILNMFQIVVEMDESVRIPKIANIMLAANADFFSLSSRIIYSTYTVIFTPLLLSAVYHDALLDVSWMWWIVCTVSLIIATTLVHDMMYILVIFYYFSHTLMVFYAIRHNVWLIYLKEELRRTKQQEEVLKHDSNMKLMMANAAHDLKTPLASLISGLVIIKNNLLSLQAFSDAASVALPPGTSMVSQKASLLAATKHIAPAPTTDYTNDMLISSSLSCIEDLASTNHFMTMCINRCIEYAKSSRGLKLSPVYDQVNLHDALALPLRVMKDIQSATQNIRVELQEVPAEICSYIITDQQWLQENLLCLLSNAVKYSYKGLVQVAVRLVDKDGAGIRADDQVDNEIIAMVDCDSNNDMEFNSPATNHIAGKSRTRGVGLLERTGLKQNKVYADIMDKSSLSALCSLVMAPSKVSTCHLPATLSTPNLPNPPPQLYLRVEVEDEGIGMTEEERGKLFAPFGQNQSLAFGSTGLGLYSLRKRVEALGGGVGVEARRDGGRGSLFWFSLPYKPNPQQEHLANDEEGVGENEGAGEGGDGIGDVDWVTERVRTGGMRSSTMRTSSDFGVGGRVYLFPSASADDATTASSSWRSAQPQPTTPHARLHSVLLVDDSPSILKMTTRLLEREGVGMEVAHNGAIALDKVRDKLDVKGNPSGLAYDCILMDLHMPVMDGLEAVKRLRLMEKEGGGGQRHVVIACSADIDDDILVLIEQAGFDACLPKPVNIPTLFETLAKLRDGLE